MTLIRRTARTAAKHYHPNDQEITMLTMTETPLAAGKPRRRRLFAYVAASALALLTLLGAAGWVAYTSDAINPERGARVACQDAVTIRLKTPATASFVGNVRITRSVGRAFIDNKFKPYVVEGHVDAQNSFGATVRTRYRCELTHRSGNWELLEEPIVD